MGSGPIRPVTGRAVSGTEDLAAPPPSGTGRVRIEDGDDWEVGFNVGAVVEIDERTRLGLIYVSEIRPEFDADVKLEPVGLKAGLDAKITFPQFVRFGIYHELSDEVALVGTIGWEDWSAFDGTGGPVGIVSRSSRARLEARGLPFQGRPALPGLRTGAVEPGDPT